ncbi:MAG: DinB family protein [Bacteroidota bacterium]|nr:DinB family protein [Bacteroidota bacterium]
MNPVNAQSKNHDRGIYPPFFNTYIKLITYDNFKLVLRNQLSEAENLFSVKTEEQSLFRYAEGKWTIKEVLQHIIDTERIFTYRALVFARKDKNTLSSFDEKEYAANSHANDRNWEELQEEFQTVRKSTIILFDSFTDDNLSTSGKINNYSLSVMAIAYIIAGHVLHHMNIIRERYSEG